MDARFVGTQGIRLGLDEAALIEFWPFVEDLLRQSRRRYRLAPAPVKSAVFPLEIQGLLERLIDVDGFVDLFREGFIKFWLIAPDGQQVTAAGVYDATSDFRRCIERVERYRSAGGGKIAQR